MLDYAEKFKDPLKTYVPLVCMLYSNCRGSPHEFLQVVLDRIKRKGRGIVVTLCELLYHHKEGGRANFEIKYNTKVV